MVSSRPRKDFVWRRRDDHLKAETFVIAGAVVVQGGTRRLSHRTVFGKLAKGKIRQGVYGRRMNWRYGLAEDDSKHVFGVIASAGDTPEIFGGETRDWTAAEQVVVRGIERRGGEKHSWRMLGGR